MLANSASIKRLLAPAPSSVGSFNWILMRLEMEEMETVVYSRRVNNNIVQRDELTIRPDNMR